MTIILHNELNGLQLEATITTGNVETHSALTEVPKDIMEDFRLVVGGLLHQLLEDANEHRKVTG